MSWLSCSNNPILWILCEPAHSFKEVVGFPLPLATKAGLPSYIPTDVSIVQPKMMGSNENHRSRFLWNQHLYSFNKKNTSKYCHITGIFFIFFCISRSYPPPKFFPPGSDSKPHPPEPMLRPFHETTTREGKTTIPVGRKRRVWREKTGSVFWG